MLLIKNLIFLIFFVSNVRGESYNCTKTFNVEIAKENGTLCELNNVTYKEKSEKFDLMADLDDYFESEIVRKEIISIKFLESNLQRIPNTLFMQVQNLKKLDISNVGLKHLDILTFNHGQNLLELQMHQNKLKSLDESYFVHNKNLKVLDMSSNQISKIKENAFNFLVNLESLSLSNNQISILEDDVFTPLVNLKWLWLDRNTISMISSYTFSSAENLHGLYLNSNKINAVSPHAFQNSHQLSFLMMSGNQCINRNFVSNKIAGSIPVKYEMKSCIKEFNKLFPDDHRSAIHLNTDIKNTEKQIEACDYVNKKLLDALKGIEEEINRVDS